MILSSLMPWSGTIKLSVRIDIKGKRKITIVGKIPWRRKWQPTPKFLPGECHGQRSLVGYSPWGHKESDTTEWLTLSFLLFSLSSDFLLAKWANSSVVMGLPMWLSGTEFACQCRRHRRCGFNPICGGQSLKYFLSALFQKNVWWLLLFTFVWVILPMFFYGLPRCH